VAGKSGWRARWGWRAVGWAASPACASSPNAHGRAFHPCPAYPLSLPDLAHLPWPTIPNPKPPPAPTLHGGAFRLCELPPSTHALGRLLSYYTPPHTHTHWSPVGPFCPNHVSKRVSCRLGPPTCRRERRGLACCRGPRGRMCRLFWRGPQGPWSGRVQPASGAHGSLILEEDLNATNRASVGCNARLVAYVALCGRWPRLDICLDGSNRPPWIPPLAGPTPSWGHHHTSWVLRAHPCANL
jgi:hypothetical protein